MTSAAAQAVVLSACPLCAGTAWKPYAQFAQFTWARCECGLIYKRSVASESQAGAAAAGHDDDDFSATGYGQRYGHRRRRRVAKSRHQILDVLNHAAPGPLLDVGCSLGYTLEAAQQLGLPASGVDVSELALRECRARGFDVRAASLTALPFASQAFAIVTMKHVLEHTGEPRAALREVRRVLRPGGALFIAVPDAGYRKARRAPERSRFYRPDSPGGVEHWVYYTPASLSRLLETEGFIVARVHPALVHRTGPAWRRWGEALAAPLRAPARGLRSALGLRKEFWLVALAPFAAGAAAAA